MIASSVLSQKDEAFACAVQSGLSRIRSWRAPPNWSRRDWLEELTAVATAAAWEALCEFDPARGVPLAGFGYCKIISRCLACYRKEWRYARHSTPVDSCGNSTLTPDSSGQRGLCAPKTDEVNQANNALRCVIGTLPIQDQRLIEQLFWQERTETEVAKVLGTTQSTISRRKHAILNRLRGKLFDSR